MSEETWYFDSGFSQHMIKNMNILTNLQSSCQDSVIFEDGTKGRIIGTDTLIFPGLTRLKEVLLIEGLKVNPISISDLCNENLFVRFTKDKCIVFYQNHYQIMEGRKSSNNCYLLTSTSIRAWDTWLRKSKHESNSLLQNISSGHPNP